MTCICPIITPSPRDYDAALFDLDGVLTRMAVALVRTHRAQQINTAVVSSSNNCAAAPISLCVEDKVHEFRSGTTRVFRTQAISRQVR
jgi:hypothetical protein